MNQSRVDPGVMRMKMMAEEYFEIAHINFDEMILHGRITVGRDEWGVRQEEALRIVLSDEQKAEIEALDSEHRRQMDKLLSGIAHAAQN